MAEVSYPFSEVGGDGGQAVVSEAQWQAMARMWGGDRVDFQLTSTSYDAGTLPFSASVINGRQMEIQPGRAWVGGFYYQLTSSTVVTIEANPTSKARKDTVVLRADLPKGSVNLATVKGQPSSSPVAPQPQRSLGQQWEMVLYEVEVPAQNGTIRPELRAPFTLPPAVATPWYTRYAMQFLPMGTFAYDLDNNGGDSQNERFNGRDGTIVTRHLGKSRTYTPTLANVQSAPSSGVSYKGRWRYIAPNVIYVSVNIDNTTGTDIKAKSGYGLGLVLPHTPNGQTGQTLEGQIRNLENKGGLPNLVAVSAMCWQGSGTTYATMYMPSPSSTKAGLDVLSVIPAKSTLVISGTYEANLFGE